MSDLATAFLDLVTDTSATAQYKVGTRRYENGREYVYTQADDTITANQVVKLDAAASTSGAKVTPTAAATDPVFGVAEVAVTDEYYFWCTVRGVASALVKTGTTAGTLVAPSSTAGALDTEPTSTAVRSGRITLLDSNSSGSDAAKNVYLH